MAAAARTSFEGGSPVCTDLTRAVQLTVQAMQQEAASQVQREKQGGVPEQPRPLSVVAGVLAG